MRLGCNIYFLFEKQAFNGLFKVIGIQKTFSLEGSVYHIQQKLPSKAAVSEN